MTGAVTGLSKTFDDDRSVGGYIKGGFKWMSPKMLNPNYEQRKFLSGLYMKPELSLGMYTDYSYYRYYRNRGYEDVFYGSVLFNIGYQAVSLNGMTLDISAGLGYYGISSNYSDDFYYAFFALGDDVPMAINFGIRLGYTFIKKKRDHTSN